MLGTFIHYICMTLAFDLYVGGVGYPYRDKLTVFNLVKRCMNDISILIYFILMWYFYLANTVKEN